MLAAGALAFCARGLPRERRCAGQELASSEGAHPEGPGGEAVMTMGAVTPEALGSEGAGGWGG